MDKKQTEEYELTINTNDITSENYVIDGQFNRVARSIGNKSSFMLPKGLYSVKVRVGDEFLEKPVTLTENKSIEFAPVAFNTPAPLSGTNDTSEFQINIASNYSKKEKPDVVLGKGSGLFLFGSIPSGTPESNLPYPNTDPAAGLTLRTFNDELLIDFGKPNIGTYSWDAEPWAACDVEITPGNYVLCLETNNGNNYKQAVVTSSGWQTQIFLQPRNYGGGKKEVKADLINCSILMSRMEYGFNPAASINFDDGTTYRLTEQIRQALKTKRKAINNELLGMLLSEKFDNPVLGIYAAHLLLKNNKDSFFSDVKTIVKNLRRLLGESHPDVEAIALRTGLPTNFKFREFPMLSDSWGYVLEASVKNLDLIPPNSLAYSLAGQFWSNEFWLTWGNNSKNEYYQLKQDILALIQEEKIVPKSIVKILSRVAKVILSNNRIKEYASNHLPFYQKAVGDIMTNLNTDKIVQVTQSLGVPYKKIIDLINQIDLNDLTIAIKKFNMQYSLEGSSFQLGIGGGKHKSNFRKIKASVKKSRIPGLFNLTINVVSTKKDLPIEGEVKFYLHETFLNPTPTVFAKNGRATLKLNGVWGSFIVGAEVDEGKTKLELDLSKLKNVPDEFRNR
jgi:hypothetical protein